MSHTDGTTSPAGESTQAAENVIAAGAQGTAESGQEHPSAGAPEAARSAGASDDVAATASDAGTGSGAGHRFEEEGDIAADYLEELLDIADIDGDIDIEVRAGRTYISILNEEGSNDQLASLIGRDGETLEALQELARLAVLTSTGDRSRLVLDITGYRDGRATELRRIAEEAVGRAKESGGNVAMAPMSSYERKLVHDVVAELGLFSESEGEGARRHIVVSVSGE